jgi:hypothetical protein
LALEIRVYAGFLPIQILGSVAVVIVLTADLLGLDLPRRLVIACLAVMLAWMVPIIVLSVRECAREFSRERDAGDDQ